MTKSIKFDWAYVGDLSKKTVNVYETFSEARKNLENIYKSIPSCWEGVDANTFENSLNNYIEVIKADEAYFQYLGDFFDVSAKAIGGTVETHAEKFKRLDNELDDKKSVAMRSLRS